MAGESWPAALGALEAEYEILRELGRGGTAFVFLARERATGREVAIKLMRAKYAEDEEALARFAREARYVEGLSHINVVPVYAVRDLGEHGLAIVMGHIAGRTLKQMIYEDGPLAPERLDRVMRDIAAALTEVHAVGIIHRDVKPENIFINEGDGRALLADFGVARTMDGDTHLTLSGVAIGTPTYMAPEQIDGVGLDQRSDLYSLGLVAWEALSGRRPWDGQSLYAVIYAQKHESLTEVRELRPDVPERLAEAIAGCLEKDPDARWESAFALIDALNGRSPKRTRKPRPMPMDTIRFSRSTPASVPASVIETPPVVIEPVAFDEPPVAVATPSEPDEVDAFIAASERRRRVAMGAMALLVVLVVATMMASLSADRGGATGPRPARNIAAAPRTQPSPAAPVAATPPVTNPVRPADQQTRTDTPATTGASDQIRTDAQGTIAFDPKATRTAPPKVAPPPSRSEPPPTTLAATPRTTPNNPPVTQPVIEKPRAPVATPVDTPATPPPPPLRVVAAHVTIVTGGLHSCMLSADGRASCWGGNDRGQLGSGNTARTSAPVAVGGDLHFTTLAAGLSHTCALARGGAAYCWGDNDHGQLGDHSTTPRVAPVRAADGIVFRSIASGAAHSCALDAGGVAWCWGANAHGQLGGGTGSDRPVPAEVRGDQRFATIEAGWNFTCALDAAGHAACWGENSAGQLGDESTSDRRAPAPVHGNIAFTALSAGSAHACGLTRAGEAYCWGRNGNGQLGDGTSTDRSTPVRVAGNERFVAISAGAVHSCALTASGDAYCWGRNTYGQLGDGGTAEHATPAKVAGGHAFAVVRAFGSHTCGATESGELFCWGFNLDGQLGDGTRIHRTRPVFVDRAGGG